MVGMPPSITCCVTSAITTRAPWEAKSRAIARPMPDAAPVTIQIWSTSLRPVMTVLPMRAGATAGNQPALPQGCSEAGRRVASQAIDRHRRAIIGRVIIDVSGLAVVCKTPFEARADLLQAGTEIRDRPHEPGRQIVDPMATGAGIQQFDHSGGGIPCIEPVAQVRARQDRRDPRSGSLHDLIRCTRRVPRGGCIFPSAETGAETANPQAEPIEIGKPQCDRLAGLFGDSIELVWTARSILR